MAIDQEAERLQRQQNYAAYKALSQEDKIKRIQAASTPEAQRAHYDNIMATYGKKQPTQPIQTMQPQQQPQQQGNNQSYIDQLNNARQQAVFAQLDKSRQGALSGLQQERSAIQPKYYDQRNQVAAGSQQSARNLAEFMAARGGTRSGANAQAEISRQGVQQGNLGTLGRQETQAYTDIERRQSDVNSAYEQDRLSAVSGIEADRMQALINQQNQDRQFGLQQQQFGLQQQGQNFNQGLQTQQFGLQSQNQNFNQNMQTQQLERGNFESDRAFEMAKGQQDWSNAFAQGQFDFNKAQQAYENTFKERSFQQDMKDTAAARGLQWANLDNQAKARIADDAFREKQFEYTKEQDTIANNIKAGKAPDYDYTTDPVFIGGIAGTGTGDLTSAMILGDAENIIGDVGFDGYNKLLAAAKAYESSRPALN